MRIIKRSIRPMTPTEKDKQMDSILESIQTGYEKLEKIESEIEDIRRKKEILYSNLTINRICDKE